MTNLKFGVLPGLKSLTSKKAFRERQIKLRSAELKSGAKLSDLGIKVRSKIIKTLK